MMSAIFSLHAVGVRCAHCAAALLGSAGRGVFTRNAPFPHVPDINGNVADIIGQVCFGHYNCRLDVIVYSDVSVLINSVFRIFLFILHRS